MNRPVFRSFFRVARAMLALGPCLVLATFTACETPQDIVHEAQPGPSPASNSSAPSISAIADVTTNQDQAFTVSFTITDPDTPLGCQSSMYVQVGDANLLPPTNVARSGTAPNCTFRFQPGTGYFGTTTVQLTVYDGKYSASTTFNVNVLVGSTTPIVSSASANEGSAETFTVSLNHALSGAKTFTYATADGTAVAGTNYTASSGSVTFAAGETVKTVTVPTIHDNVYTPSLAFSFVVNMDGNTVTRTGTITDIDGPPTASSAGASATEGNPLNFTVTLNHASSTSTTVTYATADGTATAGTNYTAASGTLTFAPGQTTQTVTVSTINNGFGGSPITMSLKLTANGVTNTATGTITNTLGALTVSAANVSVNEGTSAVFTVTLNYASSSTVTVNYSTVNGTATAGTNYASTSGTLTFNPGQTTQTVTVPTVDDGVYTPSLTFTLNLSLSGASSTATGTIVNIDSAPKATAAAASANEGSNITFTVTLDRASSTATSVTYSTTNGTAIAGTNYTSSSGILTVPAGQTSASLTVPTLHDLVYTANLTFTLSLTAGGTTNTATGTVVDIDGAPTAFVTNASANEGSNLTFTVSLNHASSTSTTVTYASANGTAVAGTNYTAVSGTLTFTPGQGSQTVTVSSIADSKYSPDLTFTLAATTNGVTNSGTGTIVNTDAAPTASAANVSANEGSPLTFTVTLNRASTVATSVTYSTTDVTAKAGVNYTSAAGTLTFAPGVTSQTLTVNSTADNTYSANLTFTLSLTAGGTMNPATGTIVNTDTVPTVSLSEAASSVVRGTSAVFTFTLNHASGYAVQVSYATSNGTATGGTDYATSSGTVTIAAGSLSSSIAVVTYDNNSDYQTKTFSMAITSASNASLGSPTSVTETLQDTTLWFDFTTASMPSGLTFGRASTATYYDSSGTLQTAASGAARFDYDPSSSCSPTCTIRGLLIEESRTNLVLESSIYNTTWTNTGCTLTANATTSPSGAADAYSLLATGGNTNTNHITQTVTLSANTTYSLSFFVKNSSSTKSQYEVSAINSGTTGKTVTLTWTGSVPSASSGTVRALPNGWYRVTETFTTNASDAGAASVNFYPSIALHNGVAYAWGAQLEAGDVPTSYIATTSGTVTRAADTLSVNSFSSWFNAAAWTSIIYLSRPNYESSSSTASPTLFSACDNTSAATCAAGYSEAVYLPADNTFRGRSAVASSIVATSNYTNAANLKDVEVEMGVTQTSAGALQTTVNGTVATASAGASLPTLNGFVLGGSGLTSAPTRQVNGHLKKFTYRARALTTTQMQAMTTE